MKMVKLCQLAFLVVLLLVSGTGQADSSSVFSLERLARVDRWLDGLVEEGQVAGGVALVLRDGKPVYERAFGFRDKEISAKMKVDDIFRIASQTKAITSAAVLILLEEGKLQLGDPVSRFIKSFTNTVVMDEKGKKVPAKRAITIEDLLTHTSGISYAWGHPQLAKQYAKKNIVAVHPRGEFVLPLVGNDEPICDAMERLGTLPIEQQPGSAFVYGLNTDVLGCVIERVSGMPLDKFIEKRITAPLKMKDTQFFLDPAKKDRLAVVYSIGADGKLERASNDAAGQGYFVEGPRKLFSGGGGLLSTAQDYARFLEMIRRGGELDGARILAPRTVALMTTDQIGGLYAPGVGFGLGFEVTKNFGSRGLQAPNAFGWSGAYGSIYRVDPSAKLTMVFLVQQLPWSHSRTLRETFPTMIYQALMEPI